MGAVYRAHDPRADRDVAVKVLHRLEERQLGRFAREVRALVALRHPNIVSVLATGEQGGYPYLVLELVRGRSLAKRLEQGPLPEREAAALLAKLAWAVDHAHAEGVLHRDLKPANVLLGVDDRPRVTDFGLARGLDGRGSLSASGVIMGTPGYAAPELLRGDHAAVGPATDVYGLGATLYAALTGRGPYETEADSPAELLIASARGRPTPPSRHGVDVDPDLERIVRRAMERRPAHRYKTAAAFARALEAWLAETGPGGRRSGRRSRRRIVVAGFGLAVAAGLGAALLPGAGPEAGAASAASPSPPPSAPPSPPPTGASPTADVVAEARAAFEERRVQRAVELASRAIAAGDGGAEPYCVRSLARGWLGDAVGSLSDARAAVRLEPERAEAWQLLGVAQRSLGELDDSLATLDRAVGLDPGSAHGYAERGHTRMVAGDARGALADFDRALELDPDLVVVLYNRALIRQQAGDLRAALRDLDEAIRRDPDYRDAYNNRGLVRRNLGDAEGGADDFRRAIELDSEDSAAWLNLGYSLMDAGDLERARYVFRRGLELEPDAHPALWLALANVCRGLNDVEGMAAAVEQALRVDPDHVGALRYRGGLREATGDLEGALADYERALAVDPRDPRAPDLRRRRDRVAAALAR